MPQQTGKVQLRVTWGKCSNETWCLLNTVNLNHQTFDSGGVYIIWHAGLKPRVVYVGQAKVFRDRLADHRTDRYIQAYAKQQLYVTWAKVNPNQQDGVEVYLASKYSSLVGKRYPTATPITVNSPWGLSSSPHARKEEPRALRLGLFGYLSI
jgi:GIY-YIG catalytic domain